MSQGPVGAWQQGAEAFQCRGTYSIMSLAITQIIAHLDGARNRQAGTAQLDPEHPLCFGLGFGQLALAIPLWPLPQPFPRQNPLAL